MNHGQNRSSDRAASVAIIALVLAIAAIAMQFVHRGPSTPNEAASSTLKQVIASKKIRAAAVPYDPLVKFDPVNGQASGYAVDVMNEMAAKAGFTVEYSPVEFGTMAVALSSHKADVIVCAIFRTPDRAKEFSFTDPIWYFGLSAIIAKSNTQLNTEADLRRPGLRVAVLAGEAGEEYLKRNLPEAKPIVLTGVDLTPVFLEVTSGRADIALGVLASCSKFARENREVRNLFAENPITIYPSSFMVRQDDPSWTAFLNTCIEQLKYTGRIDTLDRQYNKNGDWIIHPKP